MVETVDVDEIIDLDDVNLCSGRIVQNIVPPTLVDHQKHQNVFPTYLYLHEDENNGIIRQKGSISINILNPKH